MKRTKLISKAEGNASRWLRKAIGELPSGASLLECQELPAILSSLEYFIPEVLGEIYPEWKKESLDGILPVGARKTTDREAEILGLCVIISDQTLTPIRVRLLVAPFQDEIAWCECRLGERGETGMVRIPYQASRLPKLLTALDARADEIDWVYKATYERQSL
jgi:hypothetical protein